nr:hypothetical protein [uncultured Undibacterium sp.]
MIIDACNSKTFGTEITKTLIDNSELIFKYQTEDRQLMDEHLNSSPYQSLKPNCHFSAYQEFREQTLTPILATSRIRVWHYTRLTNDEADAMQKQLVLSCLDSLRLRLDNLVEKNLLTQIDSETVFSQSPFHKQFDNRVGLLSTIIIPLSPCDSRVTLLLESWGSESAYFWLSDKRIASILKKIGTPRVIEIETSLSGQLNAHSVTETILNAWAKHLGLPIKVSGCDLFITECINTAKVLRIHTEGDSCFETMATTYPKGSGALLYVQE